MKPVSPVMKATLLLCSSMTVMAGATIAPSLPQINAVFADVPQAGLLTKLVLTMPGLFIAFCAPIAGWLIDQFGRKRLLLAGLMLYGASGVSGYFLNDLYFILTGRMFLGISVAAIITTTTTLIADYFKVDAERNQFMGMQGAFMAMGGVAFIILGGFLADINWRFPFLIYLLSFVVLPAAFWVLYEPETRHHSKNNPEPESTKLSGETKKWIIINYASAFLGMALFYMIPVQIPFLLKELVSEVSNSQIGQAISTGMLAGATVSLNYQRIRRRLNFTQIYVLIFLFMGVGYFLVGQSTAYWQVLASLFTCGLGFGMMMPNTNLCLMKVAPPAMRGRIIGGVSAFIFTGQFCSPLLSAPVIEVTGSLSGAFQAVSGVLVLISTFFVWLNFSASATK